jgi:hypothetical protein
VALAGCRAEEEIRSYDVAQPDREKIRMLTAMVLAGKETWVVKLTGPEEQVAGQAKAFNDFVGSIRINEGKDKQDTPITWTVPAGWKEEKAGPMRIATFRVDNVARPMEVAVSLQKELGKEGEPNSLLDNVNRWRGQLNLPPVEAPDVEQQVCREKVDNREAILADMSGVGVYRPPSNRPAHGEMPPVAGGPGGLPGGMPGGTAKSPFAFDVPGEWVRQPQRGISVASFEIVDGKKRAEVTLTPLGAGGGGVVANVKRWREQQLGLPPATEADMMKDVASIRAAGKDAPYVDLANPKSPLPNNRILAVIIPQGGTTWFVKMTGSDELVGRQKANFEAFVRSFKLGNE